MSRTTADTSTGRLKEQQTALGIKELLAFFNTGEHAGSATA